MAELVSPGVSITVEDQSFYAPAGTGTVPLIVIATAQDKTAPNGTDTAAFTTKASANQLKLITSQRELLTNYGNPVFKSDGGTVLQGSELNEYGLHAAYSFLGLANRAYVLRADIDLDSIEGSSSAPSAAPANGTYWLDTALSVWGLKRWNGSTWVRQTVKVASTTQVDSAGIPLAAFGVDGDYAVSYHDNAGNTLEIISFYEKVNGAWVLIGGGSYTGDFQVAKHTSLPITNSSGGSLSTGDMILQMNSSNSGSNPALKIYVNGQWITLGGAGEEFAYQAYSAYDTGGTLEQADLWFDYSADQATVSMKRWNGGSTNQAQGTQLSDTAVSLTAHTNTAISFNIVVHNADEQNGNSGIIPVQLGNNSSGSAYDSDADGNASVNDIVQAINDALSAADNSLTFCDDITASNVAGKITLVSSSAYDIEIRGGNVAGFDATDIGLLDSTPYTNWEDLSFESSSTALTGTLADGTLWYDSLLDNDNIDILWNDPTSGWVAYPYDVQIAASQPTTQSDGSSSLVTNDLWVDSSDLENYPRMYKRSSAGAWVEIDTADQISQDGVLFADFRSSTGGMDSDAPSATVYPYYILGWNKRMSGGNVKKWDATNSRWEDESGNRNNGTPYMLRKAQRNVIVEALNSALASNTDARNESNRFNLIACPGYTEAMGPMNTLSADRKETAFVIGDAPLRLAADSTSIQTWAANTNNVGFNGEDGLTVFNEYSAVYYPHAITTDLSGNSVLCPGSHIALRTLAYNDQVAFPWFAPAGFQRGVVTNASGTGYLDSASGEIVPVALSESQRDTMYINKVNPIGNFPGRGLAVFGQKTLSSTASALDRVNVARLVVYIRERLDDIVKPFLFEPNDEITRQNAKVVVDRFLGGLVSNRGLFDFVTVCDTSNNTPATIDRNELHIDVAIQPLKAVEFIYIPIRVQNTLGQTG